MPLIRRDPPSRKKESAGSADLSHVDAEVRWKAAREASSVTDLEAALAAETSARVREAIFTSLLRIRSEASARVAIRFVRSDDAALRTGALDVLSAMPDVVERLLPELLSDADIDVRILSSELARFLPGDVATGLLGRLIETDADPNVCGAAVDVLADVGTAHAVRSLRMCKSRFPDEAFLGFAIDDAIERAGAGRPDSDG